MHEDQNGMANVVFVTFTDNALCCFWSWPKQSEVLTRRRLRMTQYWDGTPQKFRGHFSSLLIENLA